MDIKKHIEEAMAKPVDRRQFLMRAGAVMLAAMGVGSVLRAIGGESELDRRTRSGARMGYGSSPYGGTRTRRG